MFFFFIFGEQNYRRPLAGYEHAPPIRCANCGNYDGFAIKSRPFITFCWVVGSLSSFPLSPFLSVHGVPSSSSSSLADSQVQPVIPLSIHGYQDIHCNRCNFDQPIEHRPDVQQIKNGGAGQQQSYPPQQGYQMGPQQPRYG